MAKKPTPEAAFIEIIETRPPIQDGETVIVVPNDVRINGQSLLCPADKPVIVHEVSASAAEAVQVTLTLFARRVRVDIEEEAPGDE